MQRLGGWGQQAEAAQQQYAGRVSYPLLIGARQAGETSDLCSLRPGLVKFFLQLITITFLFLRS